MLGMVFLWEFNVLNMSIWVYEIEHLHVCYALSLQ